jgi:hypothetical protein
MAACLEVTERHYKQGGLTIMTVPGLGGKPLKFKDAEELRKDANKYFASCWEEAWEHVVIKDKQGSIVEDKWTQQFDRDGSPLMRLRERPTITGLALALGTNRMTLLDYDKRTDELGAIVREAKALVEYYYEKGTSEGDIHPAVGIFALKNFNWTDVLQINTNTQPEQLTPDDIKREIKERAKDRGQ